MNRQPIGVGDETWEGISGELTLTAPELVRRRLSELMDDPESVMRQVVPIFIDDGTLMATQIWRNDIARRQRRNQRPAARHHPLPFSTSPEDLDNFARSSDVPNSSAKH